MALVFVLLFIFFIFLVVWVLLRLFRVPYPSTFALYFGSPGCGKTTFLTRLAVKKVKKYHVFTNFDIDYPEIYSFEKSDIGTYAFPDCSLLLFDEGSLNGFDNRDFKTNFKDNNSLEYFKLLRHYRNSIVFGNQGFDELDKKIRTLTNEFWIVKKFWKFSYAIRVFKYTDVDPDTKQIIDGYRFPSGLKLLFFPRYVQIIYRPMWYKYFDSYERPALDEIDKKEWIRKESEELPAQLQRAQLETV